MRTQAEKGRLFKERHAKPGFCNSFKKCPGVYSVVTITLRSPAIRDAVQKRTFALDLCTS